MAEFVDVLVERVTERISLEFRGFWAAEDLAEELPGLIREEFYAAQEAMLLERGQ